MNIKRFAIALAPLLGVGLGTLTTPVGASELASRANDATSSLASSTLTNAESENGAIELPVRPLQNTICSSKAHALATNSEHSHITYPIARALELSFGGCGSCLVNGLPGIWIPSVGECLICKR
ncbi:hypothetical protein KR51_00013840 [Rubidibacter lacunae KORDI 51-2]|uniref:Uncharacterized protein n=1 Tax=Rubidibacter lacunae KORDI 51-2 TaxID=582515 RepID=U5DN50_9CHRO|nr:hypothetical protein KR51_00013840 [Rubidibacter lacunae KORDI 51-2]